MFMKILKPLKNFVNRDTKESCLFNPYYKVWPAMWAFFKLLERALSKVSLVLWAKNIFFYVQFLVFLRNWPCSIVTLITQQNPKNQNKTKNVKHLFLFFPFCFFLSLKSLIILVLPPLQQYKFSAHIILDFCPVWLFISWEISLFPCQ